MFRGVLLLFLSGITTAQFPVLDYLEETETCYKCDDEVAILKEVIANQSALLAQQAGQLAQQAGHLAQQAGHLAQQAGLISSLQSQMDSVVARVDSAEQFMNTCNAPSNCTEVAERSGINNQAFYVIDPDGPERGVLPMVVQCDVQGDKIITLIGHDSEARTHVNGFENRGSYSTRM
ncbi:uncharacterized protein LOC118427610 isoform X2 [Branchiostoma floridae]|uniref:Uncharacterized protein LOC118427610 isoform X2 n=1 Tax=Branchiostoma floridae TaxID=7739 RepID=A0A9J7M267_BRAFL|nr:uncharacterized protein LOC118427610 isoform X2 [Branchiostoma floridae]